MTWDSFIDFGLIVKKMLKADAETEALHERTLSQAEKTIETEASTGTLSEEEIREVRLHLEIHKMVFTGHNANQQTSAKELLKIMFVHTASEYFLDSLFNDINNLNKLLTQLGVVIEDIFYKTVDVYIEIVPAFIPLFLSKALMLPQSEEGNKLINYLSEKFDIFDKKTNTSRIIAAAQGNYLNLVQWLLIQKGPLHFQAENGRNALDVAEKYPDILTLLKSWKNLDIDSILSDENKATPKEKIILILSKFVELNSAVTWLTTEPAEVIEAKKMINALKTSSLSNNNNVPLMAINTSALDHIKNILISATSTQSKINSLDLVCQRCTGYLENLISQNDADNKDSFKPAAVTLK